MIDDDAGPKELGGEVSVQDTLNLLQLQIRQAGEAIAKLPELIAQIRAVCSHDQVIQWLGSSASCQYRFCMSCGLCEKDRWFATSTLRQFVGELRNATPIIVPREFGEQVRAAPWQYHKLPVST